MLALAVALRLFGTGTAGLANVLFTGGIGQAEAASRLGLIQALYGAGIGIAAGHSFGKHTRSLSVRSDSIWQSPRFGYTLRRKFRVERRPATWYRFNQPGVTPSLHVGSILAGPA